MDTTLTVTLLLIVVSKSLMVFYFVNPFIENIDVKMKEEALKDFKYSKQSAFCTLKEE